MTAIEKVKDMVFSIGADINMIERCEEWDGGCPEYGTVITFGEIKNKVKSIEQSLTELEAEKPAENVSDLVKEIYIDICERVEKDGYIAKGFIKTYTSIIQSFAESYHAKHCAACKDIYLDDLRHGRIK